MKQPFLTPTLVVTMIMLFVIVGSCDNNDNSNSSNSDKSSSVVPGAKVYVANEADGSVSVIDLQDSLKTTSIDLSDSAGTMFMAHNVQVAPDGKSVWVAAAGMDSSKANYLLVIDPNTGTKNLSYLISDSFLHWHNSASWNFQIVFKAPIFNYKKCYLGDIGYNRLVFYLLN